MRDSLLGEVAAGEWLLPTGSHSIYPWQGLLGSHSRVIPQWKELQAWLLHRKLFTVVPAKLAIKTPVGCQRLTREPLWNVSKSCWLGRWESHWRECPNAPHTTGQLGRCPRMEGCWIQSEKPLFLLCVSLGQKPNRI